MKLRDIINVLDSDEFRITDGEKIERVCLYDDDDLEAYMDREVKKITPYVKNVYPYNFGFNVDLVAQ
jgi:hypothetical protein